MPLTPAQQAASGVRATFFKSPEHGHVVELTIAGDLFSTNVMHKVTPEHIERFPLEWDAYQRGQPTVDYGGTSLTDVPGVEQTMLTAYALQGIHNAEQLAAMHDGQLMALGTGGRAVRDAARNLLALNEAKAKTEAAEADRVRLAELEADAENTRKAAEDHAADAEAARRQSEADAEARKLADARIAELEAMLAAAKKKAPAQSAQA